MLQATKLQGWDRATRHACVTEPRSEFFVEVLGLSGSPDSNHLSRRVECLYPHRATPVTVANCFINRILQLRQHCQAPSDSEVSADSSRIVREALNPDAWTID